MITYLVCGSRKKSNIEKVKQVLTEIYHNKLAIYSKDENMWVMKIIHGACPDSTDMVADEWAKDKDRVIVEPFPGSEGTNLKRNITMLNKAERVIAFWDGYSYGTAFTIAHAVLMKIPVTVETV